MQAESLKETIQAGANAIAAQAGVRATKMKDAVQETVTNAVEDGVATARRVVKRSRHAAEEMIDDAEHQVRQHPFRVVGITLGIGIGLGALIGVLATRQNHSSTAQGVVH